MDLYGTWHCSFFSRRGLTHHFTLILEAGQDAPVARLRLKRADPDPRDGKTEISFKVQSKVTETDGCQFVALLAEDNAGMLLTTTLKAVEDGDVLRGPLVFNSARTHEIDHEEVEWMREPASVSWQTWYSSFVAPSGNIQWFTLHLNTSRTVARLEVKVKRGDDLQLNPNIKVYIETSEPFVALLAKDYNAPHGMVSMILLPDGPNRMIGQKIWTSLTDATKGIVRVQESREILWTTVPSDDHPAAKRH